MPEKHPRYVRLLLLVIAACGWFALVSQLILILEHRVEGVGETIIRFFSYFTILTNILVAVASTVLAAHAPERIVAYFLRSGTSAALAIYIAVVGVVYNLVLRALWNPEGLQRLVDELLHSVIPVCFVGYWIAYAQKERLSWTSIPRWLIFPLVYVVYVLIRGWISGFYPYPFLDVKSLGHTRVMINIFGIVCMFVLFSLLAIFVSRLASGADKTST